MVSMIHWKEIQRWQYADLECYILCRPTELVRAIDMPPFNGYVIADVNLATRLLSDKYTEADPYPEWVHNQWDWNTVPVEIHGGLSYLRPEEDKWIYGFDCAHSNSEKLGFFNLEKVIEETNSLASQLAALMVKRK